MKTEQRESDEKARQQRVFDVESEKNVELIVEHLKISEIPNLRFGRSNLCTADVGNNQFCKDLKIACIIQESQKSLSTLQETAVTVKL